MAKLTEEQFNRITEKNKPLGLVPIDSVDTDALGLEDYDVIEDYGYGGHTLKNFYRVNSSIFQSVFDEIKNNPECSFVTPYNDIVKEGIIPEKVSVLIKDTPHHLEERIACQLLNYYGVACPVNIGVVGGELFQDNVKSLPNNKKSARFRDMTSGLLGFYSYSVSMDFMSEGDTLETFAGEDENVRFFTSRCDSIDRVRSKITEVLNSEKFEKLGKVAKQKLATQLEDEFIMSMLVRRVICCDSDFNTNNVGILTGKTPRIMNFDFELSLGKYTNKGTSLTLLKDVKIHYPKVYEKFLSKTSALCENVGNADEKLVRKTLRNPQLYVPLFDNLEFVMNCEKENFNVKKLLANKPNM